MVAVDVPNIECSAVDVRYLYSDICFAGERLKNAHYLTTVVATVVLIILIVLF